MGLVVASGSRDMDDFHFFPLSFSVFSTLSEMISTICIHGKILQKYVK